MTTGFPKSGNTWFETMFFETTALGGYSLAPEQRLPVVCELLWASCPLRRLLRQSGTSFENFLAKLLDPSQPAIDLSARQRYEMQRILDEYAIRARTIYNVFQPGQEPPSGANNLLERVLEGASRSKYHAFGCPSKHMKVGRIQRITPSFTPVCIVRDPRDVLVSYFYHDIGGHLVARTLDRFVQVRGQRVLFRPDWKQRYFCWRFRQLRRFATDLSRHNCICIRYEDLVADSPRQIARVLNILGIPFDDAVVEAVCQRYEFTKVTGTPLEQRNSFIRRGRPGDWMRHFDRELVSLIGKELTCLLVELGYENDDHWIDRLPYRANKLFDFSTFRIQRTTCYRFLDHWYSSEELRECYPLPFDFRACDNFFTYLASCGQFEVREWMDIACRLKVLWHCDVEESAFH